MKYFNLSLFIQSIMIIVYVKYFVYFYNLEPVHEILGLYT